MEAQVPDTGSEAPFYSLFIEDDCGYCVRNDDPMAAQHRHIGRRFIRDDISSLREGWLALLNMGAKIADYDDRMMPIWLSKPIRLYRAVSLHELADIVESGHINGGGNAWNGFDPRPFVFFSPAPTETCIHQGSQLDRTAAVLAYRRYDSEFAGRKADRAEDFRPFYKEELERLEAVVPFLRYTSAVIETAEVANGLHYSLEHGRTGMGGEDEFGFVPGYLRATDILTVHWVKGRDIVTSADFSTVTSTLEEIGFTAAFPGPDAPAAPSI